MSELPESSLIRKTFTIRTMDLPPNVKLTRRSMLRWFALAFGLISEKESRTTVLDVLDALFYLNLSKNSNPTVSEIQSYIKKKHSKNISEKLLHYHLNRMKETDLLIRKNQMYLFNPAPLAERDDLKASFNHYITKNISSTLTHLEEVFFELASSYKK
ncbi:MAG: hypothetical protein COT90_00785 [Candidatus Diapherotrites archaeon CG10_big_fil_rev_8_21_14_0_10_31_34]|nr:MAG: hypothetical protein COT90_00785 [Candidatus Diapherotrites archaeon CG10_big_fil_rev_8_21_14_0_10_31_34]PJA18027.1 MAG: hypothetical protein COX63_02480 [Candidatus Diapherotrites archaeon CG_4_10_14_0_2_um_filter_31_5]